MTYIVLVGLYLTVIGVYSQKKLHIYHLKPHSINKEIVIAKVNPLDFKFKKHDLVYRTNITIDKKTFLQDI